MRDHFTLAGSRTWYGQPQPDGGRVTNHKTLTHHYICPRGHRFPLTFSGDAEEIPYTWDCAVHGDKATLVDGTPPASALKQYRAKTPTDHLYTRRWCRSWRHFSWSDWTSCTAPEPTSDQRRDCRRRRRAAGRGIFGLTAHAGVSAASPGKSRNQAMSRCGFRMARM